MKMTTTNKPQRRMDLAAWLTRELGAGCVRFELRQSMATGEARVSSVGADECDGNAGELAAELNNAAYEDAEASGFPNPSRYAVLSYLAGEDSYRSRTWIVVSVNQTRDQLAPTEPATIAGSFAQHMRHEEIMFKMATHAASDSMDALREENVALRARCNELEGKYLDSLKLYESLMTMEHQRKLEQMREHRKLEMMGFAKDQLELYVPLLVGMFMDNVKTMRGGDRLQKFFALVNEEQRIRIAGILGMEQMALLASLAIDIKNGKLPTAGEQKLRALFKTLEDPQVDAILETLGGEEAEAAKLFALLFTEYADRERARVESKAKTTNGVNGAAKPPPAEGSN